MLKGQAAVFHGHDGAVAAGHVAQHFLVQRLAEAHVVVAHVEAFGGQGVGGLHGVVADVADAEDGHAALVALAHHAARADGHALQRRAPVGHHALAARVADAERAGVFGQLGGVHQVAQLLLVHRGRHHHVGDAAHVGQVVAAVVGGAVGPGKAGAVEAEHHVQVLQRHVVHHLVVAALHKRGVDVAERHQPLRGQAGRERDGVLLGNAHVEGAVGHGGHHDVQRRARGHGRRHAHDLVVGLGQLHQRVAKHVLVLGRLRLVGRLLVNLARDFVEQARRVPQRLVFLGQRVAFAFHRHAVQQLGAGNALQVVAGWLTRCCTSWPSTGPK